LQDGLFGRQQKRAFFLVISRRLLHQRNTGFAPLRRRATYVIII